MTVRKTGGGTFNPADRPMYFAAGYAPGAVNGDGPAPLPPHVLIAVNDLPGEQAERSLLWPCLDAGLNVLLDSGVFWLTNQHMRAHATSMDEALALPPEAIDGFTELHDRYLQLARRYGERLWGYIELDQGGAENKRRTRAGLEAAGLAPIPVYHPLNDGWDYFDELACTYDRICCGNIVQASQQVRVRLLHALWERHRAYPGLWVHVLGLTASELCLCLPFESCDSSSWKSIVRWNNTRTETALMRRTKGLGLPFAYELGNGTAGRRESDSLKLCIGSFVAINQVWRHASARITDCTGLGPLPAHLPGERLVSP